MKADEDINKTQRGAILTGEQIDNRKNPVRDTLRVTNIILKRITRLMLWIVTIAVGNGLFQFLVPAPSLIALTISIVSLVAVVSLFYLELKEQRRLKMHLKSCSETLERMNDTQDVSLDLLPSASASKPSTDDN